jgi:hypothetical protein
MRLDTVFDLERARVAQRHFASGRPTTNQSGLAHNDDLALCINLHPEIKIKTTKCA